ncbi:MAG: PH domain-containing protein [Thermoplasma acidophilum]|nr:PH domain-containing protein [Thermoplasma acidophilum]
MNKRGYAKTTIKSLIALLIFSSVIEISSKNIYNYLIFVATWLGLTAIYEVYKYSTKYTLEDDGVHVKSPLKSNLIYYHNIRDVFMTEGFLQRRFGLSSVYIITPKEAIAVRDLNNGKEFLNLIEDHIGRTRTD